MYISKKEYSKVLPLETDKLVEAQFNELPLSILDIDKFPSYSDLTDCYLDDGVELYRRGDTGYLQEYKFSEFNAGLANFIVNYWSVLGAKIVDPFAGRATRALVANKNKRYYEGYEISTQTYNRCIEHYTKNRYTDITLYNETGTLLSKTKDETIDLCYTCPPYWNIEEYESCNDQLSDCESYDEFLEQINTTTSNVIRTLKPGGFFVWVCADFRRNELYNFHGDSINIFKSYDNLKHYDTVIVKNRSPFASVQIGKVAAKRYTSKIHEFMIVCRKDGEYVLPTEYEQLKEEHEQNKNKFW